MSPVCVLLSLYNGSRYLPELLSSLQSNNFQFDMIVRDDGSNDNSLEIVKAFFPECKVMLDDRKNLGPSESFYELLKFAENYDYYLFCDQDDIWFGNKINNLYNLIKELDIPAMVFCNSIRSDNNQQLPIFQPIDFKINSIFENPARGCSQIINRMLRDLIIKESRPIEISYDHWTYFLAAHLGQVEKIANPLLIYRIHDNNDIGINSLLNRLLNPSCFLKDLKTYFRRTSLLLKWHIYFDGNDMTTSEILKFLKFKKIDLRIRTIDNLILKLLISMRPVRIKILNQMKNFQAS